MRICYKITQKSLKGSENSKIWSAKANNITHTLLDTWQY